MGQAGIKKMIRAIMAFSAGASIICLLIVMIVDFSTISDPAIYAYKREQVIWELLVLLSYILLSCWAVFSQKKMLVVLGSVSLLVSNLYFLIYPYQTGVGYSNDIVAYVAPCASLILVVAVVLK